MELFIFSPENYTVDVWITGFKICADNAKYDYLGGVLLDKIIPAVLVATVQCSLVTD